MELLKYIVNNILRILLHIFYLFPLNKEKIVFYPANGHYYCNLKYIYSYIIKQSSICKNCQLIWITKSLNDKSYSNDIKKIQVNSLQYFYHCLTAKIIIFNNMIGTFLPKNKGQVYLETWHGGGAYKKNDTAFKKMKSKYRKLRFNTLYRNIDYIISACESFSKVFKKDTDMANAIYLNVGLPRNDIFFDEINIKCMIHKITQYYKLSENTKLILYAPTFRDNIKFNMKLDIAQLLEFCKDTYDDKYIVMVRTHPDNDIVDFFYSIKIDDNIINVSDYPDMQELLCAADILITDYSSCMWDFSLMYKPCFIYATDIEQYKQDRDFYTPMSEWPFPIATNTDELINNILNFDEKSYIEKVKQHHLALGSYEDGHACERVCNLIEKIIEGKTTETK